MASSQRAPSRRQSLANLNTRDRDQDTDLSQSLNKLSLSTSPATLQNAPRSPSALSPYRPTASRQPNRSPSVSREPRSRSSTPTLLRKASTSSLRSANGRAPSQPPSRRSSLAHASSPSRANSMAASVPEEPPKPPLTASSVAADYFKTELDAHHAATSSSPTEAIVILHDACYGHRYSRPKTSRSLLSCIVERPERIKASALGVALAYVQLGERHQDGAFPIHPKLDPLSIPSVPFRIHKTDRRLPLLSPAVTNVHGTKWMEELRLMCMSAESKLAMGGKELQRPDMNRGGGGGGGSNNNSGDQGTPAKLHEGDLYLCAESLDAFEGALGAVCEAVDRVFTTGPRRAFVAVRPPGHHCSASYPSGFCWVNNVHVGLMHATLQHGLTHAAILDFDLHHGDGSQAIAWQHNSRGAAAAKNSAAWKKASIGYFSLHDINSYPCEMGDDEKIKNASLCIENAHGQNVWNVHLYSWNSEAEFWKHYETKYAILLEKARIFLQQQAARLRAANQTPKAAIFLSAGFDASEWETKGMQRHNVNVPTEFYARITQDVVKIAAEEGLGVEGRVVSVLEGGYSDRALFSGICSHLSGMVGDQSSTAAVTRGRGGLAYEMGPRIGTIDEAKTEAPAPSLDSLHAYDPSWWSSASLDSLEQAMATPTAEPKKPRHNTPPTYSSPTHASTQRQVQPVKMRRSLSGLSAVNGALSRPPSPPPPEVPWTTAVHELSKLLIPENRQTDSCRAEDLNAEATRARRDRQSAAVVNNGAPAAERPTSRMSLRERKPVKLAPGVQTAIIEEDEKKFKGRRKTVAGSNVLSPEKPTTRPGVESSNGIGKRTGRRLSGTTSISNASRVVSGAGSTSGDGLDSRPGSSSVAKAGDSALSVKKTRAPAATRGGATSSRGGRGGKRGGAVVVSSSAASSVASTAGRASRTPSETPDASGDDLDGITKGMKKIKINLITKAQKEERARVAEAQTQVDNAAPVPAAAVVETPSRLQENQPMAPPPFLSQRQGSATEPYFVPDVATPVTVTRSRPNSRSSRQHGTPSPALLTPSLPPKPAESAAAAADLGGQALLTPDSGRTTSLTSSSPAISPTEPAGPDLFVPYQPEGPSPVAVSRQEGLKWLPPNVTATPAAMKRTDLPVFTSTSAIPFAGLKTEEGDGQSADRPGSSPRKGKRTAAWDIPSTPNH